MQQMCCSEKNRLYYTHNARSVWPVLKELTKEYSGTKLFVKEICLSNMIL